MPAILRGSRAVSTSPSSTAATASTGARDRITRAWALGVVPPSNSPGVHSLGSGHPAEDLPRAEAGAREPRTPFRLIQAFIKAGVPASAFCYYPATGAGAGEVVRRTDAACSGDVSAVGAFEGDLESSCTAPDTARF
jgi:hypothetical protein